MSSVWFINPTGSRVIESDDWVDAGVHDAAGTFRWDATNGHSQPVVAFSVQQLAYLDAQDSEFWVGAPDGPRTVVVADPAGYVTEARVRELLGQVSVIGLTPASVGLGNVNNTSDAAKPVSVAQAVALASKADLPSGGSDGQALVKSGTTTVWATIGGGGAGGGAVNLAAVPDLDLPSGLTYRFQGSGVTQVADPDVPSGYAYSLVPTAVATVITENPDGTITTP